MDYDLILASASPRRLEILKKHGLTPLVMPSDADERVDEALTAQGPEAVVRYLAEKKAREVYERVGNDIGLSDLPDVLLAADTIVYKGEILGKPVDESDALRILSSLRAATHEVWSGVAIIKRSSGETSVLSDVTYVSFGDYPDSEILRFVREEKPYDKSGSYAIQSSWSGNVRGVDGDIENVIGLPYAKIRETLERYLYENAV